MKRNYFACLFATLCLSTTFLLSQSNPVPPINQTTRVVAPISRSQADPKAQAKILDSYGKLPLSFEANHGQTDGRVKFLSRTGGYTLFLTGDEAVLALRGTKMNQAGMPGGAHSLRSGLAAPKTGGVLRMKLRDANPAAKVTGVDELAGTSNYLIGNDPAKWRTKVPTYAKVKYEGIYSGIDLVYYGNQRQLEYDFIVAPGANPRRIQFDVRGAKRIHGDEHGDLVFKLGKDEIRWHKPLVYQENNGTRQFVAGSYAITDTNRVGFELAKYDTTRPLYIDPLIYSTYLGGNNIDVGQAIALDSTGNAYVTGFTNSTDFPTMSPFQPKLADQYDAFVAKINFAGSTLVYSTYLGGSGPDQGYGIAADSAGNAYVTGLTTSTNFPTMNPLQPTNNSVYGTAFVTKLNATGSALVYSTYLGGSGPDQGYGIAVDSAGNAYVTGGTCSTNFPTMNPLQPNYGGGNCSGFFGDAFVTVINAMGSAFVYSTYLGGSGVDYGTGIAVDSAGNAYITGSTTSDNFPTMNPLQPTNGGGTYGNDAFVTVINAMGSAFVYSTYLGGSNDDHGTGIATDGAGNAYITGLSYSTNFPTTPGAFQTTCSLAACSVGKAFVSKINPEGSTLVYSTYLGASGLGYACCGGTAGTGIAVDSAGNAYVTGSTESKVFPTTPGAFQTVCKGCGSKGAGSVFVTKFNPAGSALVYSTYVGGSGGGFEGQGGTGIAVDRGGKAYVIGYTSSAHFPTVNPLQPNLGGNTDAFLFKIGLTPATTTTASSSPNPSTYGQAVIFTATVTSSAGSPPDGETISFMKGTTVLGTGTLSGGSATFTTSTLPVATDSIIAMYSGDSTFSSSRSKAVSQVVSKATTTTTLASSLNPSNLGQSVTFTAIVTPEVGGKVTGTVTFYDGTTALKTIGVSGGTAKFTTTTLTSGTHSITATYNGSGSFLGSSGSLTQTVN